MMNYGMPFGYTILAADDETELLDILELYLEREGIAIRKARQSKGGTGLGLAIAFKIVERHGGKMAYLRLKGENVFQVTLPG